MELDYIEQGDCLELMTNIPNRSIDLILCDLPYGTTKCAWDKIISFDELWLQYERIIKDDGAIVLFSKQPFTTKIIQSNFKNYKYSLVWKKDNHDNPMMAKKRFLNITEDINIFYRQQCAYNPQGLVEVNKITKQGRGNSLSRKENGVSEYIQRFTNYPRNILEFKRDLPNAHPTQKPVALLEYLIRTYTNENDVVLDNCMESGSTCVACVNTNRHYIGFEIDEQYFDVACKRLDEVENAEILEVRK